MSIHEYDEGRRIRWERAERIAQSFHDSLERLAPEHGGKVREETPVPWREVPASQQALMRAAVNDLIDQRVIAPWSALENRNAALGEIQDTWKKLNQLLE